MHHAGYCYLFCLKQKDNTKTKLQNDKFSKEAAIKYGRTLLHKAKSTEEFQYLWTLIKDSWSTTAGVSPNFIKYFEEEYVKNADTFGWCFGSSEPGISKTNNALERMHGSIKSRYFPKKNKISLARFIGIFHYCYH